MHRIMLLTLLKNYHPAATEEIEYKERMIKFIHEHPECFERSLAVGHITASAWLLSKNRTQALLMHHAKLNRWTQLGGHCDGVADALQVAIKEAQEESGIMAIQPLSTAIFDIDIHLIPANIREAEHYHYDVRFLLGVASNEEVVQNAESKELRWISKNLSELPTSSRSVTRMFDKWIHIPECNRVNSYLDLNEPNV